MTLSAVVLLTAGVILTFIPHEILSYFYLSTDKSFQFLTQVLGALYFAFGILNWMTKTNLIGGIYNRPIAVTNLTHFFIVAIILIKVLISNPGSPFAIWIIGCFYLVFALSFGFILFRHPINEKKPV
jgi:uncharacterized membrane protein YecN with MAPEG domain